MDPDELELQLKARARLRLQQQAPAATPETTPGIGEDIVSNALPGAAMHAATGLATIPGNMDELARTVGHWLMQKISGQQLPMPGRVTEGVLPTQPELEQRLADPRGPMPVTIPEAKTGVGQVVEDVGSLAGQAAMMPAQGVKQIIGNMVRYGAVPYATGKGAGEVAALAGASPEDQAMAETAAAAATGGALAAGRRGKITGARATEDINASASGILNQAKALDIKIAQPAVSRIVDAVETHAKDDLWMPQNEPSSLEFLKGLEALKSGDVGWDYLMRYRGALRKFERDDTVRHQGKATSDGRAAGRMINIIDQEMAKVGQNEIFGTGSPDTVRSLYKQGNREWKQFRDAERIDDAFYDADISAKMARGDRDGAIRDVFRKLAKRGSIETFSQEAQDAILEVVKADKIERMQRFMGKFSPEQRPLMSAVGAGMMGWYGGPAAIAVPIAGAVGNAAAGARTLRQADEASSIVRGGVRQPNIDIRRIPMLIPGYGNMATTPPEKRELPPPQSGWPAIMGIRG